VGVEIERKFLVADPTIVDGLAGVRISQGYLLDDPASVVRVRVAGDRGYLTVKGPPTGLSRPEFEYEIPAGDATAMLATLKRGMAVEKVRHRLPIGSLTWEIDVFEGANAGLIVAEVELTDENEHVPTPAWLGPEVTADPRYLNVNLATHPYRDWAGVAAATQVAAFPQEDASSAPPLPIAGIGDIGLADAVRATGCPGCRVRRDSGAAYLRAVLWESVNDVGFRDALATGRGFCRRHSREILAADRAQSGGSLGSGILLASVVRRRLVELRGLPTGRSRRAGAALEAAGARPACPVCAQTDSAERMATDRLIARLTDPAWRQALASADLCLEHLLGAWATAVASRSENWPEVAAAQMLRIEHLVERLDSFAHHSSHDRRHLVTERERAAGGEASAFLAGWT
jgi:adenylate cyclase